MSQAYLRDLEFNDLDTVRSWRNDPRISRFMYSRHAISAEEHRAWFLRAAGEEGRYLWLFIYADAPAGFVSLSRDSSDIGVWGFYLAPDAPRGIGKIMGDKVLSRCFGNMQLHKLCGEALASNEKSIYFHRRLGFKAEGHFREQRLIKNEYVDIIQFGLLDREWLARGKDE